MNTTEIQFPPHIIAHLPEKKEYKFRYLKQDVMGYYEQFCRFCGNDVLAKKTGILLANLTELGIKPVRVEREILCHKPHISLWFEDGAEIVVMCHPFPDAVFYTIPNTGMLTDQHTEYQSYSSRAEKSNAFDEIDFIIGTLAGIIPQYEY